MNMFYNETIIFLLIIASFFNFAKSADIDEEDRNVLKKVLKSMPENILEELQANCHKNDELEMVKNVHILAEKLRDARENVTKSEVEEVFEKFGKFAEKMAEKMMELVKSVKVYSNEKRFEKAYKMEEIEYKNIICDVNNEILTEDELQRIYKCIGEIKWNKMQEALHKIAILNTMIQKQEADAEKKLHETESTLKELKERESRFMKLCKYIQDKPSFPPSNELDGIIFIGRYLIGSVVTVPMDAYAGVRKCVAEHQIKSTKKAKAKMEEKKQKIFGEGKEK